MKIASWNINGIKARLEVVISWLKKASPDVACLQEIKSVDENFPIQPFMDIGYNVVTHGQKSFNGVAILSKRPIEDTFRRLPGDDSDEQARYIEGVIPNDSGTQMIRIASLYLPNGNPIDTEKYPYKLKWMERLWVHAKTRLEEEEPFIMAGDYNIIPEPIDAANPKVWENDALFLPQTRQAYRKILNLGFIEAYRNCDASAGRYSFWDFQAGAWQKNNGIRIDHLLLSPYACDMLVSTGIDKEVRGWEKPSDHVPVWIMLN